MTLISPKSLLIGGSLSVLVACAGSGQSVVGGVGGTFENVSLRPGDSIHCMSDPCGVYFEMPAGTGVYAVTMNKKQAGKYPAGEKVFLGTYYRGSYVIKVVGTNAPPAYLGVVEE